MASCITRIYPRCNPLISRRKIAGTSSDTPSNPRRVQPITRSPATLYLVEVEQAGLFTFKNCDDAQLKQLLGVYCPSMLYPYAREVVSDMVVKGGFPPLLLQPVNFDRLYKQSREEIGPAAGSA